MGSPQHQGAAPAGRAFSPHMRLLPPPGYVMQMGRLPPPPAPVPPATQAFRSQFGEVKPFPSRCGTSLLGFRALNPKTHEYHLNLND